MALLPRAANNPMADIINNPNGSSGNNAVGWIIGVVVLVLLVVLLLYVLPRTSATAPEAQQPVAGPTDTAQDNGAPILNTTIINATTTVTNSTTTED